MLPLAVVHRQPATYELSAFRCDKQYLRAGKLHQMMIWQANSELTGIRFRASPMLAADDFSFAMQKPQAFRMVRERTAEHHQNGPLREGRGLWEGILVSLECPALMG